MESPFLVRWRVQVSDQERRCRIWFGKARATIAAIARAGPKFGEAGGLEMEFTIDGKYKMKIWKQKKNILIWIFKTFKKWNSKSKARADNSDYKR